MRFFFWRKESKPKPKPRLETASERAARMRLNLKRNPTTGELLITRRYRDACIDEIIEYLKELSCHAKS